MQSKSKLIFISIIILLFAIALLFLTANKISAQEDTDLVKEKSEEVSPQEAFLDYLESKINELPAEEKEKFEKYKEMDPVEAILKAAGKYQSQNQE